MSLVDRMVAALAERRSGETTFSSPADWLREALGAVPTFTGRHVSPEGALRLVAVYACVRIIAETVASLPLPVYRRLERGRERDPNHPLWPVLHDQANPWMTAFEFREAMMGHVLLRGNAYAEIQRNEAGRIIALWPLRPDRMLVELDDLERGLIYIYTLPDGRSLQLNPMTILHVRGLSPDGLIGYSPIRLAREAIGLGLATEEFGARFFGNGSTPGGVLEHPGKLSKDGAERLKNDWERVHSGLTNAHRVAILEEGMTWKQVGIPPEDAQFLETRKYQVTEIARLFRVPPHMLADLERATFSNIEHQSIEFVVHTIRPWLVRLEQVFQRDLFGISEGKRTHFAKFSVEGLLRGDIKSRYDAYAVGRQWGWLSADDVRELEDMNPLPDGRGTSYLVPLNMAPAGPGGQLPIPEPPAGEESN